jgi:hypothetical protein
MLAIIENILSIVEMVRMKIGNHAAILLARVSKLESRNVVFARFYQLIR